MAESAVSNTGDPKPTVIIAVDGSENSFYAFDWYMQYVYKPGTDIIVVHCPDYKHLIKTPVMSTDPNLISRMVAECEADINNILQQIKVKLADRSDVNAKLLRLTGEVGPAIVKAAQEHKVHVIVTGSRGMGTLKRTLIGSVSSYILHHAHCPVLICQQTKHSS